MRVLTTYRTIRQGRRQVLDNEQSLVLAHLKTSGVVRRVQRVLRVRNRIYETVCELRRPEATLRMLHTYESPMLAVAWSPDGSILASANFDQAVHLWDLRAPDTPRGCCVVMRVRYG